MAQTTASVTPPPPRAETPSAPPETAGPVLMIGAGDLLKVSVFGAADSDQDVRVDPEGSATLNFIGPVHLAGLTISQAPNPDCEEVGRRWLLHQASSHDI